MKRRLIRKCRDRSGETIAETLVALLISALALTMLAGAITTASKVAKRTEASMRDYYTVANWVLTGTWDAVPASGGATDKYKAKSAEGAVKINTATAPENDLLSGDGLTGVQCRTTSMFEHTMNGAIIGAYTYIAPAGG